MGECSQPMLNTEQGSSSEAARVVAPEVHPQVPQGMEIAEAEPHNLQDHVAQTFDDVMAVAVGARAWFSEASQDISDQLARGVATAQQVARVQKSRSGEFGESPNSIHFEEQEFSDAVQVQISELACRARAKAANVHAKATTVYEQASEGDVKSVIGLAAAAAVPAVAVAIAPVRCLTLAAVAATAVGAVSMISNGTFRPMGLISSETAHAEDGMPAGPVTADFRPQDIADEKLDDTTDEATDQNVRPHFSG